MRQRVLNTVAAMVVAMSAASTVGAQTAAADGPTGSGGGGATFVAFSQIFRRCDFSANTHVGPTGNAGPSALVRKTAAGVVADVQVVRAIPGTV
jgi:hypothetical protein